MKKVRKTPTRRVEEMGEVFRVIDTHNRLALNVKN